MKTQNKDIIKEFEGLRLEAYRCPANIPTIGYGHTAGVNMGDTITLDDAEALLSDDIIDSERAVNAYVKVGITQSQFDALVSFTYNVGGGNFKRSTLLSKLNSGDIQGAADEFLRWNKSGGRTLAGLVRRREAERKLFLSEVEL